MPASGVESFATRVVESEFVAKISSAYRLPDAGAARPKGPQVQVHSGCAARAECVSTWIGVLRVLRVLRELPSAVALAASSRVEPEPLSGPLPLCSGGPRLSSCSDSGAIERRVQANTEATGLIERPETPWERTLKRLGPLGR